MLDWKGLLLPFAYVSALGGMLYTFSTVYRKRKAAQSANLAAWFKPHLQKNVYSTLLEMASSEEDGVKQEIPDSLIRAALLRRAVEDINRLIHVRSSEQALNALIKAGSVGDDLQQSFARAKKEIEEELREVVMEANALAPGWGQHIFQSANEIAANSLLRSQLEEIQAQAPAEKEWWEKRRESIQKSFLKELEGENKQGQNGTKVGSDDGVLVDAETTSPRPPNRKKKGKK